MYDIYMNEEFVARISGADACGAKWCEMRKLIESVGYGKLELFDENHNLLGTYDLDAEA